jgi:hypothetical protein
MSRAMNALRKVAMSLDDVSEGIACEGTALEKRTVKVGSKAFLFLSPTDAMLKLAEASLTAAKKASKKNPNITAGKSGWVKITFDDENPPPSSINEWIVESHALMRPPKKTTTTTTTKTKKAAAKRTTKTKTKKR